MKKFFLIAIASLAGLAACAPAAIVIMSPSYSPKTVRRVALVGFTDYPGVEGSGEQVANVFEKYLTLAGYAVVDHRRVTEILNGQPSNFSAAEDPAMMQNLAKTLSVDALVYGSITVYSDTHDETVMITTPQEESMQTSVGRHGQAVTSSDVVYTQVPSTELVYAQIALSARLLDAETGELLWSASASNNPGSTAFGSNYTIAQGAEEASAALMNAVTQRIKKLSGK